MWKKWSSSTVSFSARAIIWRSTCSVFCIACSTSASLWGLCPRNDQVALVGEGDEVLFGNNKSKMENKILGSSWFCLGVKFVKQSFWASFHVTEATLEYLQKYNPKMKNPASELQPQEADTNFIPTTYRDIQHPLDTSIHIQIIALYPNHNSAESVNTKLRT